VIRQICLSCYKTVELPDDAAGKDAPCPNCGKVISVPAKYAAGVADGGGLSAVPPTPPVPPTPSPGPKLGASPMPDPSVPPGLKTETLPPPPPLPTDGPTRGVGFAFDPRWLDWVPVACVLLAFVLTFFPWTEMKLGGHSVMSQNGWGAVFASVGDPNAPKTPEWERLEKGLAGAGEDDRYKAATLRSDWLILLYLLLLIALVLVLAAERVVRDPAVFPPTASMTFLPPLWKWRLVVIGGLAVLAFLILWFQAFGGFSLQRAINNFAWYEYNQKVADTPTAGEKRDLAVRAGQTANTYQVHQTLWLNLLLGLHAVAVVALAARFWIDSRGHKPLPRLDVRW
jgi:hypothetical protein